LRHRSPKSIAPSQPLVVVVVVRNCVLINCTNYLGFSVIMIS
jgi:hypothetical protein